MEHQRERCLRTRFLTTSDVARWIERAPDTVRALDRAGKLKAIRTESGRRIFREVDVRRYLAKRHREAAATDSTNEPAA